MVVYGNQYNNMAEGLCVFSYKVCVYVLPLQLYSRYN